VTVKNNVIAKDKVIVKDVVQQAKWKTQQKGQR
jgi:hypothetical protein